MSVETEMIKKYKIQNVHIFSCRLINVEQLSGLRMSMIIRLYGDLVANHQPETHVKYFGRGLEYAIVDLNKLVIIDTQV